MDLATVPCRPEEVNQEDAETEYKQNGNIDMGHPTSTASMGIARNEDTQVQEDTRSVVTESSMASHQTSMTLRRARVSNPKERIANELSKQILSNMEKLIQEREAVEPSERQSHKSGKYSKKQRKP